MAITTAPEKPVERPRSEKRFTPPMLLFREHMELFHGLWTNQRSVKSSGFEPELRIPDFEVFVVGSDQDRDGSGAHAASGVEKSAILEVLLE